MRKFLEAYIHSVFIYTEEYIFPVLPIKYLINKDGNPTTPFKLATGMKTSISHVHVLFFPCVICKATAHVGKNPLNMRYQSKKVFSWYLHRNSTASKRVSFYEPHKCMIVSLYVVFDESFSSALSYTSQQYSGETDMQPGLSYIPFAIYSKGKNGDIIMFAHFEEGNLPS